MRTLGYTPFGFSSYCAKCAVLTLGVVVATSVSSRGADFSILMIGNSYTSGVGAGGAGNPSVDLQGLFDADPNYSASITQYSVGGGTLRGRVNDAAVTGPTGLLHNPGNAWDVVILQERSDRPALAMKSGGSHLSGLDTGGPVLIGTHIKVAQPQADVVLFNNWARFPGNQDLVDDFNNDPVEMQTLTNQGYDRIRKNSPQWDHSDATSIARVGDAWQGWYDSYTYAESSLRLHRPDGSHQNERGAYLAAAVLFEQITGVSTIGNTHTGDVSGTFGGESIVLLLQQQATMITGAQTSLSGDFDQDQDVDGADFAEWQRGMSPVPESALDLAAWRANYATANSLSAISTVVPEPSALVLQVTVTLVFCITNRRTAVLR